MIIHGVVNTQIEWFEVDLISPMKKSVLYFINNRKLDNEGNKQKVNVSKWYTFEIEIKANKYNTSKYKLHFGLIEKMKKFVEIKGRGDFIINLITFEN